MKLRIQPPLGGHTWELLAEDLEGDETFEYPQNRNEGSFNGFDSYELWEASERRRFDAAVEAVDRELSAEKGLILGVGLFHQGIWPHHGGRGGSMWEYFGCRGPELAREHARRVAERLGLPLDLTPFDNPPPR